MVEALQLRHGNLIDCYLIADEPSDAQDNADLIPNRLDTCAYMVAFVTTAARTSPWVQQEVGYAFARARMEGMRIIPLYDAKDRSSVAGLLNSRLTNIHAGFHLDDPNEEEVWKRVGDFIVKDAEGPIAMDGEIGSFSFPDSTKTHFGLILHFENRSLQLVRNATVYMILPGGYEIIWGNSAPFLRYRSGLPSPNHLDSSQSTGLLPVFHPMQPVPRFLQRMLEITPPLNLRKLTCTWFSLTDLPPLAPASQGMDVWATGPRVDELEFGIAVTAPLHVPSFYQLKMKVSSVIDPGDRASQMKILQRVPADGRLLLRDAPPHVA